MVRIVRMDAYLVAVVVNLVKVGDDVGDGGDKRSEGGHILVMVVVREVRVGDDVGDGDGERSGVGGDVGDGGGRRSEGGG